MKTILFLCTGNTCRSQMAEGFARELLPKDWKIYSAGVSPSNAVHPLTIQVMKEVGIDISGQYPKFLDEIPMDEIEHVITLCGHANETCPNFPRKVTREHWPIDDPFMELTPEKRLSAYRKVRDEIKERIEKFVEQKS